MSQWQAILEVNEADGSISAFFSSEPARRYEIYWSDSAFGRNMQWQRAAKDIAADVSGTKCGRMRET